MFLLRKSNKSGFTLIEMMVVVAIVVILAGLTFINASEAIHRSKNGQSTEESRFVTQVQSQNDYLRFSLISGTPRFSSAT